MVKELVVKGVYLVLVLILDLVKDFCWGRIEECFGEDLIFLVCFFEVVV